MQVGFGFFVRSCADEIPGVSIRPSSCEDQYDSPFLALVWNSQCHGCLSCLKVWIDNIFKEFLLRKLSMKPWLNSLVIALHTFVAQGLESWLPCAAIVTLTFCSSRSFFLKASIAMFLKFGIIWLQVSVWWNRTLGGDLRSGNENPKPITYVAATLLYLPKSSGIQITNDANPLRETKSLRSG